MLLNKFLGWLCLVGGILWGMKPVYDWLILERKINTGYEPSDPTDFIKFIFPLLCMSGLFALLSFYKNKIKIAAVILGISLILNGLFHFYEVYFYGSDIPFGLLFMLTGLLTLLIGATILFLKARKDILIPRPLSMWAGLLALCTLFFCMIPFISAITPDSIETVIMVVDMMLIGFIWAGIGVFVIQEHNRQLSTISIDV
jgi:hypothetical protein